MKISSKWYFRFSARASWIILTFRADLVHVYIRFVAMCIHIKYNTRPLCRPISFGFLHVSLFWILRVTYISYANSPASLLPLLPVYGVSNGLLFGISGYRWIEILISLNHYISKSTYLSFIGKSNYRTCWCLWTGTCVVPGHRHPPWRTMAAGTKAVHIAENHSHARGIELKATG